VRSNPESANEALDGERDDVDARGMSPPMPVQEHVREHDQREVQVTVR
jgi:hypothetical protein